MNTNDELKETVRKQIGNGMAIAVVRFLDHHRINYQETASCKNPTAALVTAMTAEGAEGETYILSESFAKEIETELIEVMPVAMALWDQGLKPEVEGLIRITGAAATMNFMLRNIREIERLVESFRRGESCPM